MKLASGRVLDTARIVAAIHPKALLPMLPEGAVNPRYARRIMGLDDTEGLFVANVAVDAAAHPALPHNIYRLHADRDGTLEDGVFYQLRPGRGDKNLLMIITKSLFSEWRRWEDTTTGRRGAAYGDEKARRADRLLGERRGDFRASERGEGPGCLYPSDRQGLGEQPPGFTLRHHAFLPSTACGDHSPSRESQGALLCRSERPVAGGAWGLFWARFRPPER